MLITASGPAGRVELRIAGRGPGLLPEDRDRAFEPFQRTETPTTPLVSASPSRRPVG